MNVAFIPVRGGSKSIPLKNIKLMNDKPLVYWAIKAAYDCTHIDRIYIATDSEIIKNTVSNFQFPKNKVEVIGRSEDTSSDTATTESAMLEFAENYDFDNIILIQATSPLLTANDLDKGFIAFKDESIDSVLSVVKQKRFYWQIKDNGFANPINYDIFNRPRRQNFDGCWVENGAFYITRKIDLLKYRNRISGNIKAVEMNEDTYFEIDEPSDWVIVENLMKKRNTENFLSIDIPEIKMFLTDCDGCLTDGGMYYSVHGEEMKKFNTKDGMGFQLLRERGIITGIITGENTDIVRKRAEKLKLDVLKMGVRDKVSVVKDLCDKYNIRLENVAYIGDDINDMDVIKIVGLGCSVNNGTQKVKDVAKYVTKTNGGEGAIREVVEKIIR